MGLKQEGFLTETVNLLESLRIGFLFDGEIRGN